ncbi:MAG TPA: Na/Pi cotransporter family protein [Hyphomicrobiaceae bacterium]|nr:Na/Pi cotransporter family protein [Hyphomicrobiaceae bacterium]
MGGSELLLTLLGAVALLLWGVRMVRTGLTRTFGAALRALLARASSNRFVAFAAGVGVTGIVQSSTATALLLASFAGRGLVTLPIALAIMLGADVGTTLVAQVFAFDIKWLWAAGLFVGVILFSSAYSDRVKSAGRIAIGLGLMLLALSLLGSVSGAMRDSAILNAIISALGTEPTIAIIVAAAMTWLAHSSLAIILFIMSLAASGAIGPALALALVVGTNIGGSIAPYVALSGSSVAARRVPLGNLLARAAIGILIIPFIGKLAALFPALTSDPARLVLNAHTAFNIVAAVVFLPLVDVMARLVRHLLPEPQGLIDRRAAQHLDPTALEAPSEALACAMRETLNVGDIVLDMLRRSLPAIEGNDMSLVRDIEKADDDVDTLHEAIKLYLIRASKTDMSEVDSRRYVEILTFTTNLEHIGDIIDKNLMELASKKIKKRYAFSAEGVAELKRFHGQVMDNMRLALNVFASRDVALARRLLLAKTDMRSREFEAAERHFARLRQGRAESIETSSIHLDVIRDLKRINSHLTSVAYPILEAAGELRESRLRVAAAEDAAAANAGAPSALPSTAARD